MPTERVPLEFDGGVNQLVDPAKLALNEAVRLKNLFPTLAGKLRKRKGAEYSTWINESLHGLDVSNMYPLTCAFPPQVPGGIIAVLLDPTNGKRYILINTDDGANVAEIPYLQDYRPQIVLFGTQAYVFTGHGSDAYDLGSIYRINCYGSGNAFRFYSGGAPGGTPLASGIRFVNTAGDTFEPSVACIYRDRMVYGGFQAPYNDYIIFSDLYEPERIEDDANYQQVNLETSGRTLRIPGFSGDNIKGLVEVATNAQTRPNQAALFILGENHASTLYGEPNQTTDTTAYIGSVEVHQLQFPCGCASADTIVKTPAGIVWANWNEVWAMKHGSMPMPVGTKIRPTLSATRADERWKWHAVYHHDTGSYRLATYTADQDADYYCAEQWWLDLRNGLPEGAAGAAWFGPQRYVPASDVATDPTYPGTFFMKTVERPGEASRVLAPHMAQHIESGDSRSLIFMEMDKLVGYDSAMSHYNTQTGATTSVYQEQGNGIEFEILTREYTGGDPMHDKLYLGLELSLWANLPIGVTAEIQTDGGKQVDGQLGMLMPRGFVTGVDGLGTRLTHEYQAVAINPSEADRYTGNRLQLRIYDEAGWPAPVDGQGSNIVMAIDDGGVLSYEVIALDSLFTDERWLALNLDDNLSFLDMIEAALDANSNPVAQGYAGSVNVSGLVEFTRDVGALSWAPIFQAGATADELRNSRILFALLGFATGANPAAGTTHTAAMGVRRALSADVEIAGMVMALHHFFRRPSGDKYEADVD